MSNNNIRKTFSAAHHAILFALIGKQVIERVGEERGEGVIRSAVRRYARQRGGRMALRAEANKHPLSMTNYLAYGEWRAGEGESEQEMVEKIPHARVLVHKCPWFVAWEENDLLSCGRLYCLDVDEALVHGFNSELEIDVHETLSNGGLHCEFVFHNANLTPENMRSLEHIKTTRPGAKAVMPWDYHLGHLYKTMGDVVIEKLGQAGREAINSALAEFANRYGEEAAKIVKTYEGTDFDRLP